MTGECGVKASVLPARRSSHADVTVPYVDIAGQIATIKTELLAAIGDVLDSRRCVACAMPSASILGPMR